MGPQVGSELPSQIWLNKAKFGLTEVGSGFSGSRTVRRVSPFHQRLKFGSSNDGGGETTDGGRATQGWWLSKNLKDS